MKIYRTLVVILSAAVVILLFLQFSRKATPAPEVAQDSPPAECVTNTVDRWHTNYVNLWHTNNVWHTNTVAEAVTKEVIKEVPAKLSDAAREAATVGYKLLHAPVSARASDTLYGAIPVGVAVSIHAEQAALGTDANALRQNVEDILRSRNIPVDRNSPHHLNVNITPAWTADVPRVALLTVGLDLKEKVALNRKGDVIQCNGIVWSSAGSRLVRSFNLAEEVNISLKEQLDKFCADYLKARETQNEIKSRIPTVPEDFLTGT